VNLRKSRFLAAALLLLIPEAFLTPHVANAATAGSGACEQTFTVSGTGTVSVYENGGYCYVAFKNTGSLNSQTVFTWTRPSLVTSSDVLVVGGGGGGGVRHGGGGGAGSFVQADSFAISSAATISVAVGSGGAAGVVGQNSYFKPTAASSSGLIAIGGGLGSAGGGGNGGSGGGAGSNQTGGSVTSQAQSTFAGVTLNGISFGNSGAGGASDSNLWDDPNDYWAGGGGGGAASAGTRPLSNGTQVSVFPNYSSATAVGGRGGDGKSASWITSTVASNLTVGQTSAGTVYFAGGGGGGMGVDGQPGVGGLGGGANGTRAESSGNAGSAFTGGGGSGSGFDDINKAGSPETVANPPGGPGGSGVVVLRYAIPDATAPTITGPSSATGATSSISISENTTSVHTFTANESVTWSKSGTDGSFFAINSSSGVLTITARDFESPADNGNNNTYVVVITATDGASNATSQTLTVTITNVNEAPVITINSSNANHAITQAENSSTVVTYTATDVDAGTSLAFSVSGTDAADFAINSSSGVLTFASAPDFEAPADSDVNNTYVVVVTVSDGALSDTQTLTVTITNANESASVNAPTVSGSINKGISATITVTLNTDGKVRFFVGGKRISNCLARSTTGSYPNFTATCSWKPPVMGSQSLTARVTPSDNSFSATTSPSTAVLVTKRANSR
jgi:VCBS repeat-containing protein